MRALYATQSAMRSMRRAAMQRGVIAILDIGTSKIACLVLRFDSSAEFRDGDGVGPMAGQSSFRVIGAATTRSRGVRFGEIHVMQETERAIRTAVQAAQKMANVRVDHVIASFAGAEPRSYGLAGDTELHNGVVTELEPFDLIVVPVSVDPENVGVMCRQQLSDCRRHLRHPRFGLRMGREPVRDTSPVTGFVDPAQR